MAKSRSSAMSDAHKEALAIGRAESRAVRKYLEALEAHKPKRGRKRTPESIRSKLSKIEAQLPEASPLDRLQLIQERLDLQNELERLENRVDPSDLEGEFAKAAKGYSDRKGISYAAWRELGVPAATLKKAGISRGS